ncbi:MAG: hypothetical protein K8H86_15690 [Ignavibacteriaceae bacterium]|nr:hypothetical protein [Ignavibacteriaceae bacterium]
MNWQKEFPAAITVSDAENKIIYMNDKSLQAFANDGGSKLIGSNLFECHSEPSNEKIQEIISGKKPNVYTIEKNRKKKFIYQTPWFEEGEYKGLVELSIEIPFDMPHFVR